MATYFYVIESVQDFKFYANDPKVEKRLDTISKKLDKALGSRLVKVRAELEGAATDMRMADKTNYKERYEAYRRAVENAIEYHNDVIDKSMEYAKKLKDGDDYDKAAYAVIVSNSKALEAINKSLKSELKILEKGFMNIMNAKAAFFEAEGDDKEKVKAKIVADIKKLVQKSHTKISSVMDKVAKLFKTLYEKIKAIGSKKK